MHHQMVNSLFNTVGLIHQGAGIDRARVTARMMKTIPDRLLTAPFAGGQDTEMVKS